MTKRDIEYNVPLRLPIPGEDTEAMFRRLVAFSYAVGRQYRADGGVAEIEDAIRTARSVGDQQAMSHMEGGPGVIEKQDVKIREPLSGYEMTVGRFPKQTAPAIEGALQTASEVAPYFTPAAPIAAARDVAVGLREGNMDDLAMSAFGIPGKLGRLAKSAAVGAYALAPDKAEAGTIIKALNAIRSYHGSPHIFERFDSGKIGTGIGAQAYGHGLYFSDNPNVARGYRHTNEPVTIGDKPISSLYEAIERKAENVPINDADKYYNRLAVIEHLMDKGDLLAVRNANERHVFEPEAYDWFRSKVEPNVKTPGGLYEVRISSDPGKFIDLYDQLSKSDPLRDRVASLAERAIKEEDFHPLFEKGQEAMKAVRNPYATGSDMQKSIEDMLGYKNNPIREYIGIPHDFKAPEAVSRYLQGEGYAGFTYPHGTDHLGEERLNRVVFDPETVHIIRRYAQGGEVDSYAGGGAIRKAMEIAQDIIHSQKKAPKIENLARVADKFVYHSGVKPDIEHMTPYLEPQHGSWIKEVASGAVDDPEEFLESANPLLWMSDKPTWVKAKIGRHLEKPINQITDDDIRNYGHVALIPRKSYEAENIWGVGPEGLSEGQYSTVSNLKTGKPTAAYNTDLYKEGREPFGVERNEYISAQPIEPMYHLTGDALLNFLKLTKNRSAGGGVDREDFGKGGVINEAVSKLLSNLKKQRPDEMRRAKEMGYDTRNIYFHGTDQPINEFNPNVYVAKDPSIAEVYARKREYEPVQLDLFKPNPAPNIIPMFAKKGSVEMTNPLASYYKVFDPTHLRSVFADFNPEHANSADLMKSDGGSVIKDALDVVYGLPRAAEAETSA